VARNCHKGSLVDTMVYMKVYIILCESGLIQCKRWALLSSRQAAMYHVEARNTCGRVMQLLEKFEGAKEEELGLTDEVLI
jgi:hypothetical protein